MGFQKGDAGMEVIKQVDTVRGKVKILFESGWQVWLPADRLPEFYPGEEIDRDKFEKYILLQQYPAAIEKAVSMLAARSCSRAEIEKKLNYHHFDSAVTELVIYKLEKENILNDLDFTEQWIQSRIKRYGKDRIFRELIYKGVDYDMAREALNSITDEEQLQHAVLLARKKASAGKNITDRRKLFRQITEMLLRKGYTWETAKKAYNIVIGDFSE